MYGYLFCGYQQWSVGGAICLALSALWSRLYSSLFVTDIYVKIKPVVLLHPLGVHSGSVGLTVIDDPPSPRSLKANGVGKPLWRQEDDED